MSSSSDYYLNGLPSTIESQFDFVIRVFNPSPKAIEESFGEYGEFASILEAGDENAAHTFFSKKSLVLSDSARALCAHLGGKGTPNMIRSYLQYYQNHYDFELTARVLNSVMNRKEGVQELATLILDAIEKNKNHYDYSVNSICLLRQCIEKSLQTGEATTADRLIKFYPKVNLSLLDSIIIEFSFPTADPYDSRSITLTEEQRTHLLSLTKPFTLTQVMYCCYVAQYKAKKERRLIKDADRFRSLQMGIPSDSEKIFMDELYEYYKKMIHSLLDQIDVRDVGEIYRCMKSLACQGEGVFLEIFYQRFGEQLPLEKLFNVMTNLTSEPMDAESKFEFFKTFFAKFNSEFNDTQKTGLNEYIDALREQDNMEDYIELVRNHIEACIPDLSRG